MGDIDGPSRAICTPPPLRAPALEFKSIQVKFSRANEMAQEHFKSTVVYK